VRASAWALSAFVYTVLTAILGRDVLAQLGTTIANDAGDPLLTAAILYWNAQHVPWTDAWWQFPIYYPTGDTLAFSEHLLGLSVIATPIAWLTGNPLAAYNLTLLLTFPLCGMAMFALVYHLTRSAPAAFLAGLAYAFAPYRISNLPHIQMLASFWAPLALLGLHGFVRAAAPGRRWPWLALFGMCWALQAAANWYTLVLFSVFVALWVLWFVVVPGNWRALGLIAAAGGLGAVPLAPIVHRYVTVHAFHGFERSVEEMRTYSADVAAVLCAPPNLTFWGWLQVACRAEGELFPGVALFVLFVAAVVATARGGGIPDAGATGAQRLPRSLSILRLVFVGIAALYCAVLASVVFIGPWRVDAAFIHISASAVDKPLLIALAAGVAALLIALGAEVTRSPRSVIGFYLFAAVVTWLLALGPIVTMMGQPSGRPGPFVLLQSLPGVGGMRVPARFWLLTVICLTTVAGLLMARLFARRSRRARAGILVVVGCALLADSWAAPIPAPAPPMTVANPEVLRDQVVLHVPVEPYPDLAATWRAVTGGWKSVNGYSGYAPNYYTALTVASKIGDETMFAPFRRDHDLHVVVDDSAGDALAIVGRQPGAALTARRNGFTQYRLPRRADESTDTPGHVVPIASLRSSCAGASASLARDGDERTRWECLQDAEQHGLVADVGAARALSAVVYSVGPYAWNVPTQLRIETSTDGVAWLLVRTGSILGALIEGGLADADALRAVLPFPVHTARYVRVRPINQSADFGWFVSEIEVLGP
jgi:hypothetical protein